MARDWKAQELVALLRLRYPDWDGFDHPRFYADEVKYKQATIAKARGLLNASELEQLLAAGDHEAFISRLDAIGKDNNLLWRRVPTAGDLGILYQPHLEKATFCQAVYELLYEAGPSPERLQTFAGYASAHNLPNKWTFPTYFLFICHPDSELFVKPRTAEWFLKFMGLLDHLPAIPTAEAYSTILENARNLRKALQPYRPHDMVDVQSLIWICARESQQRTGRLDPRGQIELDVPATTAGPAYQIATYANAVHDRDFDENPPYTLAECAEETGFAEEDLAAWVKAIERKGQAILYGPPGTGKTYLALQLARHLVGGGDGFYDLVQLHPAYAYEDFIQGIRPQNQPDGSLRYPLIPGRFLEFLQEAKRRYGRCVLIIDEINRANLPRVFGELMYLLEYRDQQAQLAGGGMLEIPANLRIIGTMNTADRSIALVDYALRRRFAFIPLYPNYEVLIHFHERQQTGFPVANLVKVLQRINNQIGDPHYAIGITFFLLADLEQQIESIWRLEIEPYLEEYFFSQPERLEEFRWWRIKNAI